jgi:Ca2+-binding RTX toxin-like protein
MRNKITTLVAGLAVGLLALAPAAAQAQSSVSVGLNPVPEGGYVIHVVGDDSDNYINLADQSDPTCPGGSPCYEVRSPYASIIPSAPCVVAASEDGDHRALCPAKDVSWAAAFGREGEDTIVVSDFVFGPNLPVALLGGPGDDSLQGSGGDDTLHGGEGDDTMQARGGADYVFGNAGGDRAYGSTGPDIIEGGAGLDNLVGGIGDDELLGGAGNDGMDGAQGHDRCFGGKGRDAPRHCEKVRSAP